MTEKIPEPNTIKSEHLKEGVQPIIACIESLEDFNRDYDKTLQKVTAISTSGSGTIETLREKNFLFAANGCYMISPINSENKISDGYIMCTGIVATGIDAKTGKNISFLSHQYPGAFLSQGKDSEQFSRDLQQRLLELKQKCVPNSVDIVIVGGQYTEFDDSQKQYKDSIGFLTEKIKEIFDFEPVVITGPKKDDWEKGFDEKVICDTQNRRLYIIRPNVGDSSSESYLPKQIDQQSQKWDQEIEEDSKKRGW